MAIADELRNELKNELPSDLRERVVKSLRSSGRWSIICDTHINDVNWGFSIPYRLWTPVEEWAHSEGLRVSCQLNSYGVKHLVITL